MRMRFGRPGRQRGILGFDIGGGSEDVSTTSESKKKEERRLTESQERQRATEREEATTSKRITTALPAEIQAVLQQLITSGAGPGGVGGASTGQDVAELGRFLTTRATEAEAAIGEDVGAIVDAARRRGERDVRRVVTDLSQQAGSSQQSFVQQVGLEAGAQLESELAALEAESSLRGRSAATEEFQGALTALLGAPTAAGTETQALVALSNALRGATTTEVGEQEVAGRQQEQDVATRNLSEIIKSLLETETEGTKEEFDVGFSLEF